VPPLAGGPNNACAPTQPHYVGFVVPKKIILDEIENILLESSIKLNIISTIAIDGYTTVLNMLPIHSTKTS
jgi:hypothetical protein